MTTHYTTNTAPQSLGRFDSEHGPVEWLLSDGIVYPTTICCGASAKGAEDGIVCRSCYEYIDPWFGMGFSIPELISGKVAIFMGERLGR